MPTEDDELLAMHPTFDSGPGWEDDAAREAAYWARLWDLEALPVVEPEPRECDRDDCTGDDGRCWGCEA